MSESNDGGGLISKLGWLVDWFESKELASVMTTVQRHTAFLDSPLIARNIAVSSFDPSLLRTSRATVYLCLPVDRLGTMAAVQRLWLNTIIRTLIKDNTGERRPVLFFLDEVAHLGRISVLEDAVTLMRGMGVRLLFGFQSPDNVKKLYGTNVQAILDNIGTQLFFGTGSLESAESISKRIGDATILVESINRTSSTTTPFGSGKDQGGSHSASNSLTYSPHSRALFQTSEILTMREDMALLLHKNMCATPVQLVRYYDAPEFSRGGGGSRRRASLAAGVVATVALAIGVCFLGVAMYLPLLVDKARQVKLLPSLPPLPITWPQPRYPNDGVTRDGRIITPPFRPGGFPSNNRRPTIFIPNSQWRVQPDGRLIRIR